MMQELNYIRCGDYYIPDIRLPEETRPIGHWGRMHRDYIKEHNLCTQKELADSLHISPASVATSIKRLEKTGFVKRATDKDDVRKNRLSLTDDGLNILREFRIICDETDKKMFTGFSEEECGLLCSFLQRLYNNLDTENLTNCQMKAEIEKDEKKAKEEIGND